MILSARNVAPWQRRGAPAARWPGTAPETASSVNGRSTSSFVLCLHKARMQRIHKAEISQQRPQVKLQVSGLGLVLVLVLVARRRGHSYKSCE